MKAICQTIDPLCRNQNLKYIFFVPDEVWSAYIPEVHNTFTNVILRIAALVTERGEQSIDDAKQIEIPDDDMEENLPYDEQFKLIVNKGYLMIENHECISNCEEKWKNMTDKRDDEIFDRESFINEIRMLQRNIDNNNLCASLNTDKIFPNEHCLKIYTNVYIETIEKITNILEQHNECVYVFIMEYFDMDEDRLKLSFKYGGDKDVGGDEIKFIHDFLDPATKIQ